MFSDVHPFRYRLAHSLFASLFATKELRKLIGSLRVDKDMHRDTDLKDPLHHKRPTTPRTIQNTEYCFHSPRRRQQLHATEATLR